MSTLSGYTSVFRVQLGGDNSRNIAGENSNGVRLVQNQGTVSSSAAAPLIRRSQPRTKARPIVSCLSCRSRKQKCDRLLPCGTCCRRGNGALCRYGTEGGISSVSQRTPAASSAAVAGVAGAEYGKTSTGATAHKVSVIGPAYGVRHEAQVRLQRLEEMVNRMITMRKPAGAAEDRQGLIKTGGANTATAARYDMTMPIGVGDSQPPSAGQVASLIGEAPFVGATNWVAVLDSIRDIKSYLGEGQASDGPGEHGDDVEREDEKDMEGPNTALEGTNVAASGGSMTARDSIATQLLLETTEADGIFATVTATSDPTDSGRFNTSSTTSAVAQTPRRLLKQLAEAVSCLPSRQDCDRLLSIYFQSSYMTGPFVHTDAFQRACSRFWRTGNPASAHAASPLLWVSMLASVLNIAAMISGGRQLSWMADRDRDGSVKEPKAEPQNKDLVLAGQLRKLSTRCLLAGDYLSGRPLAIEALLLNAHVRLMQRRDHDAALWATFSVAVRLAQRMGYQQVDAPTGSAYGVGGHILTPFEKEMRRRAWYFVESFDMLYSFQFGMPTMIHEDETSTDPPRNLRDDDFDETSAVLPPGRPASDYTPVLYFSVKLNLIRLLRKVLRFAVWRSDKVKRQDGAANKATITKLTDELTREYAAVPSRLRMPVHIRDCPFSDASYDIMHRLAIELISHKATCILLRESLSRDISRIEEHGGVDMYGFSAAETKAQRQACLVSALRILDLHTDFEYETRPASTAAAATAGGSPDEFEKARGGGTSPRGPGRLATDRHMLGTLAMHDFLLAATIVCLDLIEQGHSKSADEKSSNGHIPASATATDDATTEPAPAHSVCLGDGEPLLKERAADRHAKLDALRRAYALWHEQRLTSRDAAHAARVLGAIVTKLSSDGGGGGNSNASTTATAELSDNTGDWGIAAQLARRDQIVLESRQRERAQRGHKAATAATSASVLDDTPFSFVNGADQQPRQQHEDQPMQDLPSMTQPPPAHLNYAYEWAEPGPFGAALNDPRNVDWNMVDAFLLDRQLDTEVGGNIWSAELMSLEN